MRSTVNARLGLMLAAAIAAVLTSTQPMAAQSILPREPPAGGLRRGEVALVDDGSCPKGMVRRVEGVFTVDLERSSRGTQRVRSCVRRPF